MEFNANVAFSTKYLKKERSAKGVGQSGGGHWEKHDPQVLIYALMEPNSSVSLA